MKLMRFNALGRVTDIDFSGDSAGVRFECWLVFVCDFYQRIDETHETGKDDFNQQVRIVHMGISSVQAFPGELKNV